MYHSNESENLRLLLLFILQSGKYFADDAPYQFGKGAEARKLYEQQLRQPIGKEWNTQKQFENLSRPHIRVKVGTVIDPLHRPILVTDVKKMGSKGSRTITTAAKSRNKNRRPLEGGKRKPKNLSMKGLDEE